jgi:AraC family transcriptional regulator of adaptative response/methylated-DNA-[protein]-cysteine methyltransferase
MPRAPSSRQLIEPRPNSSDPALHTDYWTAVRTRDASFDGTFYYGVITTGIYCRPSCHARLPKRENVEFHDSTKSAKRAGFRPCKRCKPDAPPLSRQHAETIAHACRLIEQSEDPPSLAALAHAANLSASHFHRVFKSVTGLTPKDYAAAHRHQQVRALLPAKQTITATIHEAGFNACSRLYANATEFLGMTPTAYRAGGKDIALRFALGQCSLGAILVAASDKGIAAILLGDDPAALLRDLEDRFANANLIGGDATFEDVVAKVVGLVERPETQFDLPLDVRGTAFQHRVWQALRQIPAGTTASYSDIANRIGMPKAVRAVAAACAANNIAVAIPCHRVVRSDGALSGYRWGIDRKRELLKRESSG